MKVSTITDSAPFRALAVLSTSAVLLALFAACSGNDITTPVTSDSYHSQDDPPRVVDPPALEDDGTTGGGQSDTTSDGEDTKGTDTPDSDTLGGEGSGE